MPNITLTALVLLFGAYALVDGVVCITGAVRAIEKHERWGSLLFGGFTGVAAAVVTVFWPAMTAVALVFVIGAWAVVTGIFQIVAAVRLRKYIAGEWLLILGGIASVLFGVLITIAPLAGALVIALWVGAYTLVFGVLLIALAFRLRSWEKAAPAGPSITVPAH
jgi:uncharacterized membrane protein HdeD (DUF308 family)